MARIVDFILSYTMARMIDFLGKEFPQLWGWLGVR